MAKGVESVHGRLGQIRVGKDLGLAAASGGSGLSMWSLMSSSLIYDVSESTSDRLMAWDDQSCICRGTRTSLRPSCQLIILQDEQLTRTVDRVSVNSFGSV